MMRALLKAVPSGERQTGSSDQLSAGQDPESRRDGPPASQIARRELGSVTSWVIRRATSSSRLEFSVTGAYRVLAITFFRDRFLRRIREQFQGDCHFGGSASRAGGVRGVW